MNAECDKPRSSRSTPRSLAAATLLVMASTSLAHAERRTTYYHTDALGSVVAASDQSGALLWRKQYAPFGEQLDSTAGGDERLAYTGKQHDNVLGLTYFGARYYDPHIGRFVSVDPAGFDPSNPTSFNRYAYVNNNPYKYVDPDGELLNFAAKFVLDVGINVAFNYVTTGQLNVGGALKESAVGILNPAKTLTKAAKLGKALAKTAKKADPPKQALSDDTIRIRHYTNTKGQDGIQADQVIRASDQNKVFAELARGKPLSPRDAEARYGLRRGRGNKIVETDVPASRVKRVYNPSTKVEELQIEGDVPLRNPSYPR